ncbi:MAG: antibiotic biosynthesis monooxygenase [Terrestrivirus sp.]|uniref:Antibiotic biosynthesis monooxygenase n=1 Tax=Terrestrivirus sp. TaxID=2487775 RepID=A0A3G4ZLZ5_9VIRU|nr:MAG: antibiotic biosynthesis monooxygenase [Terrestrivirus sp.]
MSVLNDKIIKYQKKLLLNYDTKKKQVYLKKMNYYTNMIGGSQDNKHNVVALIQLIVKPENRKDMINILLDIMQRDIIHYSKSIPGAFYILSKWKTESDMDEYLQNFSQNLIPKLTSYIVAQPTISRARMLSQQSSSISSHINNSNAFALIPFFYIIPNAIETVKEAHLSVVDSTRKEPGCLEYDLYQLIDNPAIMFFYENWSGTEALSTHMNTSNFYRVVRGQVDKQLLVPWTALELEIVNIKK